MDKDQYDRLRADIRLTLQAISDNLLELDDYLKRLHEQAIVEINAAMLAKDEIPQEVLDALMRSRAPGVAVPMDTTDPRRPYQNQRQPRRDGDSFGSVPIPKDTRGIDYGTKTEEPGE